MGGHGGAGWGDLVVGSAPSLRLAGGGFEWDDDFPLMPVKPSLMSSLTPAEPELAVPALPALVPVQKQVLPIQFSRFTVSPAPVSRFSITHVSDSDMDSIGGECPPPLPARCSAGGPDPRHPWGGWRAAVPRCQLRWEPGGVWDTLPSCPMGTVTPLRRAGCPAGPAHAISPLFAGSSEDGDRE